MDKKITFTLWIPCDLTSGQCTIENQLASRQRCRFRTWETALSISAERLPASSAALLPSSTRELGTSGGTSLTDPFVRTFSLARRQFSLPATSAHCLALTLAPGTGESAQAPRISVSIASCLSLQPQSRSQASVSNCQTKGSQTCRGQSLFFSETGFPSTSPTVSEGVIRFIQTLSLYVHFNNTSNPILSSKCIYQEVIF